MRQTCSRRLRLPIWCHLLIFSFTTCSFVCKVCHICYYDVSIADVAAAFKSGGLIMKTFTSELSSSSCCGVSIFIVHDAYVTWHLLYKSNPCKPWCCKMCYRACIGYSSRSCGPVLPKVTWNISKSVQMAKCLRSRYPQHRGPCQTAYRPNT